MDFNLWHRVFVPYQYFPGLRRIYLPSFHDFSILSSCSDYTQNSSLSHFGFIAHITILCNMEKHSYI